MNIICKRKITKFLIVVNCTISLGFLACGPYSFSGSSVPSHLKTIAVPLVADQTSEFGVRESLTDAIISEITEDNSMKITNESEANAILSGRIIALDDRADTFTADENVESYRVYITVEFEVQDRVKNTSLWKEKWSQWGLYKLNESPTREEGIQEAIEKIAEDILNKTVSGW